MDAGPDTRHGQVSLRHDAGTTVLVLTGEIDLLVVREFEEAQGSAPVSVDAIDAGAVTYIGSIGLALLLRWATPAGGPLPLRSSPQLDRVLELTQLAGLFQRTPGP